MAGFVTMAQIALYLDESEDAFNAGLAPVEVAPWLHANPYQVGDKQIIVELVAMEKCVDLIAESLGVKSDALARFGIDGALGDKAASQRAAAEAAAAQAASEVAAAASAEADAAMAAAKARTARVALIREAAESEKLRAASMRAAAEVSKARELMRLSDEEGRSVDAQAQAAQSNSAAAAQAKDRALASLTQQHRQFSLAFSPAQHASVIATAFIYIFVLVSAWLAGVRLFDVPNW